MKVKATLHLLGSIAEKDYSEAVDAQYNWADNSETASSILRMTITIKNHAKTNTLDNIMASRRHNIITKLFYAQSNRIRCNIQQCFTTITHIQNLSKNVWFKRYLRTFELAKRSSAVGWQCRTAKWHFTLT